MLCTEMVTLHPGPGAQICTVTGASVTALVLRTCSLELCESQFIYLFRRDNPSPVITNESISQGKHANVVNTATATRQFVELGGGAIIRKALVTRLPRGDHKVPPLEDLRYLVLEIAKVEAEVALKAREAARRIARQNPAPTPEGTCPPPSARQPSYLNAAHPYYQVVITHVLCATA